MIGRAAPFVRDQEIVRSGIQDCANPKQGSEIWLAQTTHVMPVPTLRQARAAGYLGIR